MRFIIFITLFFPPLIFAHFYPFTNFIEQAVAASFLILGLVFVLLEINKKFSVTRFVFLWAALGILWLFVGFSNDLPRSSTWLWHLLFWVFGLCALLLGGIVKNKLESDSLAILIAWALVFSSLLQVLVGLIQYYGLLELIFPWANYGGSRLSGTLGQSNMTAFSLSLGCLSSLFLFYEFRLSRSLFFLVSVFLIFAIFLTGSRSAAIYALVFIVASVAVILFGFQVSRKRIAFGLSSFILILIAGYGLTPFIDETLTNYTSAWTSSEQGGGERSIERFSDFSSNERLCEWEKTLQFLSSGKVEALGQGLGTYSSFSFQRDMAEMTDCGVDKMWDHPHNLMISALVEWGWVGFLVVGLMLFYVFRLILKKDKDCSWFFVSSAILMFLSYSMLEYPFWNFYFLAVFLIFVTLLDDELPVKCSSTFVPKISAFMLGSVFCVVIYSTVFHYFEITEIFNKKEVSVNDKRTLYSLGSNSLYGGDAVLVRYYRFLPEPTQISQQILEAKNILAWQPNPLALTRLTLLGMLGSEFDACLSYRQLKRKYPRFIRVLNSDIVLLRNNGFAFKQELGRCDF